MNVKYHAAVGMMGSVFFGPTFFIGAIFPDVALIKNEWKLYRTKRRFNENQVSKTEWVVYMCFHSLFLTALLFHVEPILAIGHLFHIVPDWFTHTGRFSARPFYPFNYVFKWGRECLK